MAKKNYNDEYLDKLDRISRLKKNGDITEEEYQKEKDKIQNTKKRQESPTFVLKKLVAFLLFIVIPIIFIAWVVSSLGEDQTNTEPTNNSKLNLSVSRSLSGIEVINNEQENLIGCNVTINGKYTSKVESIEPQAKTYPFAGFTDSNSTRFNILTTEVDSVYITGCNGSPERAATYTW